MVWIMPDLLPREVRWLLIGAVSVLPCTAGILFDLAVQLTNFQTFPFRALGLFQNPNFF